MRKILCLIVLLVTFFAFSSCEADKETYNSFIGNWHLSLINANGEYRAPIPNKEGYFNLHFMENNSLLGESAGSNFSAVYTIKKKNKMTWTGFTYLPVENDSTDNVAFINNMLKVDTYEMSGDTLKFLYDKKTYLTFVRR